MNGAGGENHRPGKRFGSQVDGNSSKTLKTDKIRIRPVLMERTVHIDDLKNLEFDSQSLSTVFIERGWTGRLLETKGKVYSDIVYDFYEQLRKSNRLSFQLSVIIRQVKVVISPKEIASFLNDLPRKHPNPRSSQHHHVDDKIYGALTGIDQRVQHDDLNKVISVKDMLPFFQKLHHIVAANIRPTNQTSDISIEQGKFLLDIAYGIDIDLPYQIFETIKNAAASRSSMECLPFGQLITGLSLKAGVKPRSNEKEVKPVDPIKPISQTGPPASCPSTQEASRTLPPGFNVIFLERFAEISIAPIQRELKAMDARLKALEDRVQESRSP